MIRSYSGSVSMDLGEAIHVYAEVSTECGDDVDFVVLTAQYELTAPDGTVEDSGSCTIDGSTLDAFICPAGCGRYMLKYTYTVADETWVDVVKVKVV